MDKRRLTLWVVIGLSSAAAAFVMHWLLLPSARAAFSAQDASAAGVPAAQLLSEQERLIQETVSLLEKFDAYATQPGWTLLEFEQIELLTYNSPKPLPPRYQGEYWYHFNEKPQVFEAVHYVIAPELGRVLMGYELNGEWVSVWHGIRGVQHPYTPSFNLSLVRSITGLAAHEGFSELSLRETTLRGRPVRVVELKLAYSAEAKKYPVVGIDKPVWGTYELFYVDPETGMVLRCEHYFVLEDNTLVPAGSLDQWQIVANVEPPVDVLEVLRKARMEEDER